MTDFIFLLACAAGSAYGAYTAMRRSPTRILGLLAVLLWTFTGIQAVLLVSLSGDGRILPGYQINPLVKQHWGNVVSEGSIFTPEPAWCLLALLAHAVTLLPRPRAARSLLPIPATILFVVLFFVMRDRAASADTTYERALGPEGRAAFLTHVAGPSGRLILSAGDEESPFLRVYFVRGMEQRPPDPRIYWTKDGEGIILSSRLRRIYAIDREGNETGAIPEAPNAWPLANTAMETSAMRRSLTASERAVAEFVQQHGGMDVR